MNVLVFVSTAIFFCLFSSAVFISLPIHFRALVFVAVRSPAPRIYLWHEFLALSFFFSLNFYHTIERESARWVARTELRLEQWNEIKKRMKRRNPLLLMGSTQQHRRARVSHLLLFFHYFSFRYYSTFNSIRMKSTNNSKIHETSTWRWDDDGENTRMLLLLKWNGRTEWWSSRWAVERMRPNAGYEYISHLQRRLGAVKFLEHNKESCVYFFFDFFFSLPCEWIVVQLTFTSQ